MNSLGEKIAHYRKKAGLTQEQLAEKCSVTAQAVSKWENDITSPDISLIATLAEIFKISCDELLGVSRAEIARIDPELVDLNKMLLKVKILSKQGDDVKINLPLSIAEVCLKAGIIRVGDNEEGSEILKKIDINQILQLVKCGAVGKLVEIKSADGDTVEIWVE